MSRLDFLYHYEALLLRVIDADTIEVDLDIGFSMHLRTKLRLLRVNAVERNTPQGLEAFARTIEVLRNAEDLVVQTKKPDAFGRQLAEVFCVYQNQEINVSDYLRANYPDLFLEYKK